jgi:hypothetical protein
MTTIYIAGPMRGYPEHNFPAFDRASIMFRELGFSVRSPVEIGWSHFRNDPAVPGAEYIRADVEALARCDRIALLPGWEASTGARCEVAVAITLGLVFYDATNALPIPTPERVTVCGGYERPPGAVELLDALLTEVRAWANATFGGMERQPSKIAHLRKEVDELAKAPHDVEEMADVFILLAHISDGHDLTGAVRAKFEKNKRRVWGKADAEGVIEHVRGGTA